MARVAHHVDHLVTALLTSADAGLAPSPRPSATGGSVTARSSSLLHHVGQ
jgi:hypothetical protein